MRATEERDAHDRLPGHVRLHVDLCAHAQNATADHAQSENIPHTEAICRLLFFGYYTALLAGEAATAKRARLTVAFEVAEDGEHVLVVRRATRRRWRMLFRATRTTEQVRYRCPGPHSDNRLVIE